MDQHAGVVETGMRRGEVDAVDLIADAHHRLRRRPAPRPVEQRAEVLVRHEGHVAHAELGGGSAQFGLQSVAERRHGDDAQGPRHRKSPARIRVDPFGFRLVA